MIRDDVFIHVVTLPDSVKSAVTICEDGYNIFINKKITHEQMQEAYAHEMYHIDNGHCEDDVDVDKIEGELYEKERCRDY